MDFIQSIFENGVLTESIGLIRAIFTLLNIFLFVGFVFAFTKSLHYRPEFRVLRKPKKKVRTLRTAVIQEHWQAILKKLTPHSQDAMRLAIIEADSLVDSVLKQFGLQGEHMADRLSKLDPEDVETLERLWRAHRIRNDLVHTPGFRISPHDAKRTLDDYEAFLKEMKVF